MIDFSNYPADPEIDRKAGDEYSLPEKEGYILENVNIVPSDETVKFSDVLPSAPPYESHNLKLENTEVVFDKSDQGIEIMFEEDYSTPTENKTNLISHSISGDETCSHSCKCTDEKGLKISIKPSSPNSSFGFIPHLNETSVKQESPKAFHSPKPSKDPNFGRGIVAEVSDLAGQFSETLEDLAQKFDSAETNLDVEFQKAKEISDVMHGRSLRADFNEGNNLNFNAAKEDGSTEEKKYKSSSVEIDSYVDVVGMSDISSEREMFERSFDTQRKDKPLISPCVKEIKEDFKTDQQENKLRSSQIQALAAEGDINEEPELHHTKKHSFIPKNSSNDDKIRTNTVNSTAAIDEEWRKRWYEAHPCLDNSSNRLRQTPPRGNTGSQVYLNGLNISTTSSVGEAGDVPPDLFRHTPESNLTRNSKHLESNSRVERNVSFSPILEEHFPQDNIPTDEIHRKEITNNPDKDVVRTKATNSYSSNVPYAWRKMSKHQARYLETEKQVWKQLKESCGESIVSRENQSIGDSKVTSTQVTSTPTLHGSLSEIIVEKQRSQGIYDNEANNEKETTRNNELEDCKEESFKHNFKDSTHKVLQSSPLDKTDPFKADKPEGINLHVSNIDDKSVRDFTEFIEKDRDAFQIKEKPFLDERKKATHEKQNELEKNNDFDAFSTSEKDKMLYRNEKTKNVDDCENKTPRPASNEDLISEVKEDIRAYQRIDNSSKAEPGLDSAGGDFTSPNINENEELLNSPDYAEHDASPDHQEITVEYVGEIIERMIQQDSLSDSYEGLNFSSYSDNDSSDMESEYSDAEDSNLYTEMCEP